MIEKQTLRQYDTFKLCPNSSQTTGESRPYKERNIIMEGAKWIDYVNRHVKLEEYLRWCPNVSSEGVMIGGNE